ncbi:DUF2163 domain-containing protein [Croceicoccus naphthovorans]|uniref:Bacteriophage phiJL001 Gp84 C-terminal domain-containing protein n=1 Tax=Croceicoccus naphthovorans TaxID=1348774 RepID=A0A0G3XCK1_9SPHN|nr:DUF2163 domain-containing protein [Croceicoccus naphthovorans]AKM09280.1 hypothetical protein AB433_03675 [Croceicoccus naphthovorans]MBB3990179.1 putative phage protein (TIGR02218 family) [Croceicoccus naphthovorans]
MSRDWFTEELETVATWWRVYRRDGVTVGLTSHDRDLVFDDIRHQTAPGMVPSAIRLSADFEPDSAEVTGAFDHHAITAEDLAAGRFDGARVEMGVVDWETRETEMIYSGTIGRVEEDGPSFSAELQSEKARLSVDLIPRTSPTCRADFCGPECGLSSALFTHETTVSKIDFEDNAITLSAGPSAADLLDGSVTWIDGKTAGLSHRIAAVDGNRLILDPFIRNFENVDARVSVRQGCDHRWQTCADRFDNAVNFRGEPFLPGNDLLTRYPKAK